MRSELFGQYDSDSPDALQPVQAAKCSKRVPISNDPVGKRGPDTTQGLNLLSCRQVEVDDRRNRGRVGWRAVSRPDFPDAPCAGVALSDHGVDSCYLVPQSLRRGPVSVT